MDDNIYIKFTIKNNNKKIKKPRLFLYSWVYKGTRFI